MTQPRRTPAVYRRDLCRARQVVGKLRDDAMESGDVFQVGDRALDAAALDALWDGLDRVDSHAVDLFSILGPGGPRSGSLDSSRDRYSSLRLRPAVNPAWTQPRPSCEIQAGYPC